MQADVTYVHLEFEPIFKNPDLTVKDWMDDFVLKDGIVGVIRVAYGRTEAELQENIEKDNTVAAYLRDGTGNHNWSYKQKNGDPQQHGRVWITVPLLPEEAGEFDKMLLRKIIIDHPRD